MDREWLQAAACKGVPVEMFYPEDTANYDYKKQLKRMCASCPVLMECFEWAVAHETHGWWAGTSPLDRRAIRKQRNIFVSEVHLPLLPIAEDRVA